MSDKTLTKADIVDTLYERTPQNRSEAKRLLESLLQLAKTALKRDESLLVSGLGKFEVYDKNPRKGRNPQTNKTMTLAARKVVVFRLSRKLRAELNKE